MTPRGWALAYAELGWRSFPVVPGGKRPLYRGWQRDATTDSAEIARYWRSEPWPNIGLVCGERFDVFDIEAAHVAALGAWLDAAGRAVPETPLARTGRGGVHILVAPTGLGRGRDLYLDGVHVGELKSRGGFIVVAPSVTERPYAWAVRPDMTPLAPVPGWLLDLVGRPRPVIQRTHSRLISVTAGERRLAALANAVGSATEGRRNKYLFWATRRALEEGIPAGIAGRVLSRAAVAAGLDTSEIDRTLASALGTPPR